MEFSENYVITSNDISAGNTARLSTVLGFLQDVATCQTERFGPTYDTLAQQNRAFFVSRIAMNLYKDLYLYDRVKSVTFACDSSGVRFNRYAKLLRDGEICAEIATVWALVEGVFPERGQERKLLRTTDITLGFGTLPMPETNLKTRLTIPRDLSWETAGYHRVTYRDADLNQHMHNTLYPDVFCEYIENIEKRRVTALNISFLSEAPLGSEFEIRMGKTEPVPGVNDFYFRTFFPDGRMGTEAVITVTDR